MRFGRLALLLFLPLSTSAVWAQSVPPNIAHPPMQSQPEPDWKALTAEVRGQRDRASQVGQDAQAENAVLRSDLAKAKVDADTAAKAKAALDAYLKACADKPGCTVPAE